MEGLGQDPALQQLVLTASEMLAPHGVWQAAWAVPVP